MIKQHTSIPVFVMIRPRGGDFLYSDLEYDVMRKDIEIFKENGADGFVFGVLKKYDFFEIVLYKAATQCSVSSVETNCFKLVFYIHHSSHYYYFHLKTTDYRLTSSFNQIDLGQNFE